MTNKTRLAAEAFLLVLVGGGVLWAQVPRNYGGAKPTTPIPDVIRAREFQMVDKKGKVLAAMRVNDAFGGPVVQASEFHVVDDQGYVRAAMRLSGSDGGPNVTFWSKDAKKVIAQLSLNEGDRPMLILAGGAGEQQLTAMVTDNGLDAVLAGENGNQAELKMSVPKTGPTQVLLDGVELVPVNSGKK